MNHINRIAIEFAIAGGDRPAEPDMLPEATADRPQGRDVLRMACRLFLNRQSQSGDARPAENKA